MPLLRALQTLAAKYSHRVTQKAVAKKTGTAHAVTILKPVKKPQAATLSTKNYCHKQTCFEAWQDFKNGNKQKQKATATKRAVCCNLSEAH